MDFTMETFRAMIKSILRTSQHGQMKLVELEKDFKRTEGKSLSKTASEFGFASSEHLLKSFEELEVVGIGFNAMIICKQLDHIAKMNNFKKNSSRGIPKNFNFKRSSNHRTFHGKDELAFSLSSGEADRDLDFEINWKNPKYQENLKALKMEKQPKLIQSIDDSVLNIQDDIPNDTKLTISVLEVINPHRFWFVEYSDYKKLDAVMGKMQEFYKKEENFIIAQNQFKVGLVIAGRYSGLWHRGKIIKILSSTTVRVFYFDFGTTDDVNISESIRYLAKEFIELPMILRRGVLSHVIPTKKVWSDKSIEYFKIKVLNRKIQTKVFSTNKRDASYFVALESPDGDMIADLMMMKLFCVYDGYFFEKEIIDEDLLDFEAYEKGQMLEGVPVGPQKSWLPNPALSSISTSKVKFDSSSVCSSGSKKTPIKKSSNGSELAFHSSSSFEMPLSTSTRLIDQPAPKLVEPTSLEKYYTSPHQPQIPTWAGQPRSSPRLRLEISRPLDCSSGVTSLSSTVRFKNNTNISSVSKDNKQQPLEKIQTPAVISKTDETLVETANYQKLVEMGTKHAESLLEKTKNSGEVLITETSQEKRPAIQVAFLQKFQRDSKLPATPQETPEIDQKLKKEKEMIKEIQQVGEKLDQAEQEATKTKEVTPELLKPRQIIDTNQEKRPAIQVALLRKFFKKDLEVSATPPDMPEINQKAKKKSDIEMSASKDQKIYEKACQAEQVQAMQPPKLEEIYMQQPKLRQIVPQILANFKVGSAKEIYIHSIIDTQNFYFYVKNEFGGLQKFFQDFHNDCNRELSPNDDFTIGTDVVTYSDDNFCRGRIVEKLENGKLFKIFHVDFGVTIDRQKLFKLKDKWMNQQAAVYRGKLADVPENVSIDNRQKLYGLSKDRFIVAKIHQVHDDCVEIILID